MRALDKLDFYREHLQAVRLREDCELFEYPIANSEQEVQARWFAGDYGSEFQTTDGQRATVVQFGVWNRESGPDFIDAAVRFEDGTVMHGAIEIDMDERDWERHGHSTNPAYEKVILHVVLARGNARFFTRTAFGRNVKQIVVSSCLPGGGKVPPLAKPGRCVAPLANLPPASVKSLLETAALHRMRSKGARLARLASAHGPDEALFMGLAEALGYRDNQTPFFLLAARLGLKELKKYRSEAVLLGVSGLLERVSPARADGAYLRSIWEAWWPLRANLERLILPAGSWKLSGVRPANHPQRRLAALGQLVDKWRKMRSVVESADPRKITEFFTGLRHPFWDFHATLTSQAWKRPLALIGEDRAREIIVNVVAPLAIEREPAAFERYREIKAGPPSRKLQIARRRLFGNNQSLASFACQGAVHEQGVLQVYADFCQRDASDCAECRFPGLVAQWH